MNVNKNTDQSMCGDITSLLNILEIVANSTQINPTHRCNFVDLSCFFLVCGESERRNGGFASRVREEMEVKNDKH